MVLAVLEASSLSFCHSVYSPFLNGFSTDCDLIEVLEIFRAAVI